MAELNPLEGAEIAVAMTSLSRGRTSTWFNSSFYAEFVGMDTADLAIAAEQPWSASYQLKNGIEAARKGRNARPSLRPR
ncbi:MAG: hypothetical protein LBU32_31160 [Clostridiales bacterium]|jgi:hypothetical protein|nr:hypothetical protein [Clostridiales bacterium]